MRLGTTKGLKEKQRKKLIKKCDELVSLIVRKRDGKCVVCGSTQNLTCGHLITRNCKIIRWELTNNNCQCRSCNFTHEFRPERYTSWWVNKYGLDAYNELVRLSNQTKKWTVFELEDLKKNLESILGEL